MRMHINMWIYWVANKCLTHTKTIKEEYTLFSVYMLACNELHIYSVWTSSVIMIYILLWFNPMHKYTQKMCYIKMFFSFGLVDIFVVIDHCIIFRKDIMWCNVCKCESSYHHVHPFSPCNIIFNTLTMVLLFCI